MQGLQNYYNKIPVDWKKESVKSFFSGFFWQVVVRHKNFNTALQNSFYYFLAEAICQVTYPLLKKNKETLAISKIAIKNFTILTGITKNIDFSLKTTLFATSTKIAEFLLQPHLPKGGLDFFSCLVNNFRVGIYFYENNDTALKSALISTIAKHAFENSYYYIKDRTSSSNQNSKPASLFEEKLIDLECFLVKSTTIGFNLFYGKSWHIYGLSTLPNIILLLELSLAKSKIKKVIKHITNREADSFTRSELDNFWKELSENPLQKVKQIFRK